MHREILNEFTRRALLAGFSAPVCSKINVVDGTDSFIPYFPLGGGRVAGEILNQVARAHHVDPHQVAIAWLFKRSPVTLPIPGTSSIRHLEGNIAAASLHLSDEEYHRLAKAPQLAA
jgi:diketogulonate reductase-like aldo/keto reductase